MESVTKSVKFILLIGFLILPLEITCVPAHGLCDISIISGNATVISTMIRSYISEKELENHVLCSLGAASRVFCYLSPTGYLELDQTTLDVGEMGLNFTLMKSVDEVADKPTSLTMISCLMSCDSSEASLSAKVNYFSASINLVNDHTPLITWDNNVIDDLPEFFPYGNHAFDLNFLYSLNIAATDQDTVLDPSSRVTFSITDGNEGGTFSIETTTVNPDSATESFVANIFLEKQLNYEENPNYNLTIQAQDQGNPTLSSTMTLTINIQRNNDTLGPAFDRNFYRATINASDFDGGKHSVNIEPIAIHAKDQDTGSDVGIKYKILVDDCGLSCDAIRNAFSIDETTAVVTFDSSAHYEDIDNSVAVFEAQAIGHDAHKRTTLATVSIYLSLPTPTTTDAPTKITT